MHLVIDGTPAIHDVRAVQRYTQHLILELSKLISGYELTILYLGYQASLQNRLLAVSPNVRVIHSRIPGKLLTLTWRLFRRPTLSHWISGTVNLLHFPGGYPYVPAKGIIRVTTLHGLSYLQIPEHLNDQYTTAATKTLKYTLDNSDHIITVSQSTKVELCNRFAIEADRVTPIPLGISPEFEEIEIAPDVKTDVLTRYGIPNKKILLFVGVLERHKNVPNIIEAFFRLGDDFREQWQLVLVGKKGPTFGDCLDVLKKRRLETEISIVDYIQPGSIDLAYLYNLATLFVFPSFYESWASPPLEAMKCGTPVIVSDISQLRESTGGNAVYVNPSKPDDIAAAVWRLSSDPELYSQLQQRGIKFAAQFTWQRCAAQTLALYDRLLERSS